MLGGSDNMVPAAGEGARGDGGRGGGGQKMRKETKPFTAASEPKLRMTV